MMRHIPTTLQRLAIFAPVASGLGAGAAVCIVAGIVIMVALNLVNNVTQPMLFVGSLSHLTIGPAALVSGLSAAYTCRLQRTSTSARLNPVGLAIIAALLHISIWIWLLRTYLLFVPSLFALDLLLIMITPMLVRMMQRQ